VEEATVRTMPRIARACRIPTLPFPAGMEAARGKVYNRARRPDSRRSEAPAPNPEASEWATCRFPGTHPARTGAPSAASGTVVRRSRIATMDIQALERPGAAEAPRAEEDSAAAVAAVAAAGTDRRKGKPWQE